MGQFQFFSVGSGSSGNCYYVGTEEYGFLIDVGVGIRNIKRALKDNGLSIEKIWGIFITHDHTDHIRSAGILGEKFNIPIYTTREVHEGINRNFHIEPKLQTSRKYIKKGESVIIRDFSFNAFPVSHDASDSMGFTVTFGKHCLVIATDLGYIGKEAADQIAKANYLVIEANYDDLMLKNGPYPYPLKQRVRSHTGHLCNDHTALFLADNWHPGLTHVFLCHLSQDNNTPELAYQTVLNALETKGIELKVLHPLERLTPSRLYLFDD